MKRLITLLLVIGITTFGYSNVKALALHINPIQYQDRELKTVEKSIEGKKEAVKELSIKHQKKLNKKAKKLERKLKKRGVKTSGYSDFSDVFGERYFILGSIFVLGGLALAILGSILGIGLFGWFGGIAMVVGLVLIILAILQVT